MLRGSRHVLLLGVLAATVAGCGGGDDGEEEEGGSAGAPCPRVEAPRAKEVTVPRPGREIEPGEQVTAVFETSCGSFEVALDTERASMTANSFAYLVRQGFYNGLGFHRVIPGALIQGGDPKGDGTGGPGYFIDEPPPPNLAYTDGVVAMAKSPVEPPGRSGSQFFVVTAPDLGLGPDYALLGKVTRGMGVVRRIASLGEARTQLPSRPVVIERATLQRR